MCIVSYRDILCNIVSYPSFSPKAVSCLHPLVHAVASRRGRPPMPESRGGQRCTWSSGRWHQELVNCNAKLHPHKLLKVSDIYWATWRNKDRVLRDQHLEEPRVIDFLLNFSNIAASCGNKDHQWTTEVWKHNELARQVLQPSVTVLLTLSVAVSGCPTSIPVCFHLSSRMTKTIYCHLYSSLYCHWNLVTEATCRQRLIFLCLKAAQVNDLLRSVCKHWY